MGSRNINRWYEISVEYYPDDEVIGGNFYVIEAPDSFKFGISKDPHTRFLTLQSANSEALRFLCSIKFPNMKAAECFEKLVLGHYNRYRKRGEWLRKTQVVKNFVEKLAVFSYFQDETHQQCSAFRMQKYYDNLRGEKNEHTENL